MYIIRRIVAIMSLPLALIMLITGISAVTPSRQKELEAATEASTQADFVPVFRFAVATDVHINANDSTTATRLGQLFETAYRYADGHPDYNCLDALVLTGDNCDSGSDAEYEILTRVINENKREETALIAIMGNHEFGTTGHEGFLRHMGQDLDPHVVVKGYHFIGLSPDPKDTWHTPKQINWMSRQLREAAKDDPEKPIFTMQHGHIWNTVYVSRSWSTQMSLPLHAVYARYPQVINFSGHSHGPVNNPLSIWQNSYTQVGAGTLNYFEMERDIGDETVPDGARKAAQYIIVEVDAGNRVRMMPYNLLTDDFMKTPATDDGDKQLIWQIDDVCDPRTFAYTSARKKTDGAPSFGEGAEVAVDGAAADSVTLSFPQAEDDVCVYGYRVQIRKSGKKKVAAEKEIYSEYYFEPMPERLSVTVDGLEAGTGYEASVIPLNVWLDKGEPIRVSFTTAGN
ncbi:MAG: metallophosphoesterase [Clostridiales bacterium]|nr:metallophosphoesterase [Clostridiales bacterium]